MTRYQKQKTKYFDKIDKITKDALITTEKRIIIIIIQSMIVKKFFPDKHTHTHDFNTFFFV